MRRIPRVLSYNLETESCEYQNVTATRTSYSADIVEVRTSEGGRLRCTASHRIYTRDRGYVEAGDCQPGQGLVLLRELSAPLHNQTLRLAKSHRPRGRPRTRPVHRQSHRRRARRHTRPAATTGRRPQRRGDLSRAQPPSAHTIASTRNGPGYPNTAAGTRAHSNPRSVSSGSRPSAPTGSTRLLGVRPAATANASWCATRADGRRTCQDRIDGHGEVTALPARNPSRPTTTVGLSDFLCNRT